MPNCADRMKSMMDSEVLIVGAGPTGLTLAIDLGRRGVRCTLIEQKERPAFLPKMERVNARTMEIYRRMGLAQKIRAAGLRPDCPMDVYIILALNEPPLLHLPYPSVAQAQAKTRATNDGTHAARALSAHLAIHARAAAEIGRRDHPGGHGALRLRIRVAAAGRRRRHRARARRPAAIEEMRAAYLVGCDGGASPVRKELGIELARRRQSAGAAAGALSLRRVVRPAADRQRPRSGAGTITSPTTRRRS